MSGIVYDRYWQAPHSWPVRVPSLLSDTFRAGQEVPITGLYLAEHFRHRDAHEVTLVRGHRFPFCEGCGFGVVFTLLEVAGGDAPHAIILHRIPDVSEADSDAA